MNKYFLLFTLSVFFILGCKEKSTSQGGENTPVLPKISMTKIWESDTLFTTCESVIYDAQRDVIYVSNIDGQPWDDDKKGSIGKLNVDGTVINAKWVEGLSAPKGLGLIDNILYVTDISNIVAINVETGTIANSYPVEGSQGLNDVTTATDGTVYVSDSKSGIIYMLKDGVVSTLVEGFRGSNGVHVESDRLLIGTGGNSSLTAYKFSDQTSSIIAKEIPQPDGIEPVGDGSYLVSSWKGMIHFVHPDGTKELLLNTSIDSIYSADIDYIESKKMVLVPTFFGNSVVAYTLEK